MAAPTPTVLTRNVGRGVIATWHAVWTDTNNLTDSIVVNLSAMEYTAQVKVEQLWVDATAGISAALEWDGDAADVLIYRHPVGSVGNAYFDFRSAPDGGLVFATQVAADTGDIVVTTTSAANTDEVMIVLIGRVD